MDNGTIIISYILQLSKKGDVQRDTIHRFLTDVYGEESYKQPKNTLYICMPGIYIYIYMYIIMFQLIQNRA